MTAGARRTSATGMLKLYAAFWEYAAGRRLRIAASSSLLVLSQVVKLAIPWLAAQAINPIQSHGAAGLERAAGWIALILAAAAASWAMHGPGRIIERSVGVWVRENLADRLYARLAELPLAWHEKHHSGETVLRMRQTSNALFDFAQSQFIYLQSFVNLTGPVIALALLSAPLGVAALAGYTIIGIVAIAFDRALARLVAEQNRAERRYAGTLTDCLGNVATILSLRLQRATRKLVGERLAAVFLPLRRSIVLNEWKWCGVDLLSITVAWALVALYAVLSQRSGGALLVGDVFMVYLYAQQAGGVIGSIAMNYQQFARIQVDYAAAEPIWAAAPRPAVPAAIAPDWREIALERVALHYTRRAGDPPALVDATLRLRRGERIALVGPSGAGKSTLLRVLGGLYDAEDGRFVIDGIPVLGLRHLGAVATLIQQDPQAFEGSLAQNVDFGLEHPSGTRDRAIRLAGLDTVVRGLPDGLDTPVAERGTNLSGGQRQRLALARGVLAAAQSSLVLLDEPTSSLDAVTEARVVTGLLDAFPAACIVASIHRLDLLPFFDRVVLMGRGRVVDEGTIAELTARQPLFRKMHARASAEEPALERATAGG